MKSDAKILLVGSHAILMGSIAARLEYEHRCSVAGLVATQAQAVGVLSEKSADVDIVLIDADEAWRNGEDRISTLRVACPEVAVILIGTTIDDVHMELVLSAGVRSFLFKNEWPANLAEAVRVVLAGGVHFPREIRSRIVLDPLGLRLTDSAACDEDDPGLA